MPNTPPAQNQTQQTQASQSTNIPPATQTPPETSTPKKNAPWLLIFIIVLLLSVLGFFSYQTYYKQNRTKSHTQQEFNTCNINNLYFLTKNPTKFYKYNINNDTLTTLIDKDIKDVSSLTLVNDGFFYYDDVKGNIYHFSEIDQKTKLVVDHTKLNENIIDPYGSKYWEEPLAISQNEKFLVIGTDTTKQIGAGNQTNYHLVDIKSGNIAQITNYPIKLLDGTEITNIGIPQWINNTLIFRLLGSYDVSNDRIQYSISNGEFSKYNPFNLNSIDFNNFRGIYSPDQQLVITSISQENDYASRDEYVLNTFSGEKIKLPEFKRFDKFSCNGEYLLKNNQSHAYTYDLNNLGKTEKVEEYQVFQEDENKYSIRDILYVNDNDIIVEAWNYNNYSEESLIDLRNNKRYEYPLGSGQYLGINNNDIYIFKNNSIYTLKKGKENELSLDVDGLEIVKIYPEKNIVSTNTDILKKFINENSSGISSYISNDSGITLTYPNEFGDFELDITEDIQDSLEFTNSDDPSKNIYIILSKRGVNRGSVINGVQLSVFETTPYQSTQGEEFNIISYQVDDKSNTYYLEAFNNPQEDKVETIYIKIVGSLSLDQLRKAEEYFKDIISGIIINKPDKIIQTTELISRWTNSTDCPRTILTFKSNEIIDVFSCDIKHQTVVNSTGKYYIGNNNYISYNYHINDKIMNSHALEATWEQNEWILIDKKGGENYDQEIRYTKIN